MGTSMFYLMMEIINNFIIDIILYSFWFKLNHENIFYFLLSGKENKTKADNEISKRNQTKKDI